MTIKSEVEDCDSDQGIASSSSDPQKPPPHLTQLNSHESSDRNYLQTYNSGEQRDKRVTDEQIEDLKIHDLM